MRAATERKKGCVKRRREGRGPSYNAPLVHCPDEVRKRGEEGKRVPCPLARFNFSPLSLSYTGLPRSVPPALSSSLHSPPGEIKSGTVKGKGRQKEGVRREERREGGEGGGGHGGEERGTREGGRG